VTAESRPPLLRVISGDPSEEELAAIIAAVNVAAVNIAAVSTRSRRTASPAPHFSLWARKARQVRPAQRPGFGAWRASTLPR
jgi:hypothetical protein